MSGQGQECEDIRAMERLGEGDDLALQELMNRWKEPLTSFSLRYTGNVADAREIAQETFVRVYRSRHRYRPKSKFSTWVFSIAANLCRTRNRWRQRHPEVLEITPDDGRERAGPPDPSTELDRRILADDLERAIRTLPHQMRTAFILFEIDGNSYEEVSTILRCSVKSVERRLAHARRHLRAHLERHWRSA